MKRFNIRVYGIIINDKNQVLLSDEFRHNRTFTKFPGGGMVWGEGTKDCLKRELQEELNIQTEIGEVFYLTDFFQVSAFNKEDQIVSIYYLVKKFEVDKIAVHTSSVQLTKDGEEFRWKSIKDLSPSDVTFPIDKKVIQKLIEL